MNFGGNKAHIEKTRKRVLALCKPGDFGICPPPLDAQVALNELCRYFLGDGWYASLPLPQEQVNTEIVFDIECLYKGAADAGKGE
jgi:hypothetical protein